jgi:hypothetical protein
MKFINESITMKFINEVVKGGVTIILFVVRNLVCVCVLKKRNLSTFRGLKGAWKHIRILEWKWDGLEKAFGIASQSYFR